MGREGMYINAYIRHVPISHFVTWRMQLSQMSQFKQIGLPDRQGKVFQQIFPFTGNRQHLNIAILNSTCMQFFFFQLFDASLTQIIEEARDTIAAFY